MKRTVFFVVPFSSTVVLLMNVFWRVSSRSWDQCNAWHRWAPDRRTASTYSSQTQSRKMKHRLHNSPLHTRGGAGRGTTALLTVSRWVRWCFALSLELLKALLHPGCWHRYGFSPVWLRRWIFRFSSRENAFLQPLNCNHIWIQHTWWS